MEQKNYLIINTETGVCENIIVWDGDESVWMPPQGYKAIPQESSVAKVWITDDSQNPSVFLAEVLGAAKIGFTWDGSVLTTDQPKPVV